MARPPYPACALAAGLAFLAGLAGPFLHFSYPETDIDAIQKFAEEQNSAYGRFLYSEAMPAMVHEDRLGNPMVLLSVSCDTPIASIRLMSNLFDTGIPIYYDFGAYDPDDGRLRSLDIVPCMKPSGFE